MRVDVYRVGVAANLYRARRYLTTPASEFRQKGLAPPTMGERTGRAGWEIRHALNTMRRHVSRRQWRELRQDFNGWLAEPTPWPEGIGLTRCGHGWTRTNAIMSLYRHAHAEAGPLTRASPNLYQAILDALKGGQKEPAS